ncbi:hypothetical protein ACWKT5_11805 [Streptomyces avermitilis]
MSTRAPAVAPPSVGHAERLPAGHAEPLPAGHAERLPAGHAEPLPAGHAEPLPAGHAERLPAGHAEPLPAGHAERLPAGHAEPLPADHAERLPAGLVRDRRYSRRGPQVLNAGGPPSAARYDDRAALIIGETSACRAAPEEPFLHRKRPPAADGRWIGSRPGIRTTSKRIQPGGRTMTPCTSI